MALAQHYARNFPPRSGFAMPAGVVPDAAPADLHASWMAFGRPPELRARVQQELLPHLQSLHPDFDAQDGVRLLGLVQSRIGACAALHPQAQLVVSVETGDAQAGAPFPPPVLTESRIGLSAGRVSLSVWLAALAELDETQQLALLHRRLAYMDALLRMLELTDMAGTSQMLGQERARSGAQALQIQRLVKNFAALRDAARDLAQTALPPAARNEALRTQILPKLQQTLQQTRHIQAQVSDPGMRHILGRVVEQLRALPEQLPMVRAALAAPAVRAVPIAMRAGETSARISPALLARALPQHRVAGAALPARASVVPAGRATVRAAPLLGMLPLALWQNKAAPVGAVPQNSLPRHVGGLPITAAHLSPEAVPMALARAPTVMGPITGPIMGVMSGVGKAAHTPVVNSTSVSNAAVSNAAGAALSASALPALKIVPAAEAMPLRAAEVVPVSTISVAVPPAGLPPVLPPLVVSVNQHVPVLHAAMNAESLRAADRSGVIIPPPVVQKAAVPAEVRPDARRDLRPEARIDGAQVAEISLIAAAPRHHVAPVVVAAEPKAAMPPAVPVAAQIAPPTRERLVRGNVPATVATPISGAATSALPTSAAPLSILAAAAAPLARDVPARDVHAGDARGGDDPAAKKPIEKAFAMGCAGCTTRNCAACGLGGAKADAGASAAAHAGTRSAAPAETGAPVKTQYRQAAQGACAGCGGGGCAACGRNTFSNAALVAALADFKPQPKG